MNDPAKTPAGARLDADLTRLRLIYDARGNGATWAIIGRTLGMSGREAKRHAHRLGAKAGQAWRLQQNQEQG